MSEPATAIKTVLRRRRQWLPKRVHPSQLLVLSFAGVITIGTILLSLPTASRSGRPLSLLDAFFTATSATCVTGLVVVDTSTQFSLFGQLVILACIQIGGLGLMTFTTVFLLATGRRLAIGDRIAIQESFYHGPTGKLSTLILYIFVATVITECAGGLLLTWWWLRIGEAKTIGEALYQGMFHAIGAFSNAGFGLYPDNAMRFQSDPVVLGILSTLIIAGGLGFLVTLDLKEYLQQRYFSRLWSDRVRKRVEAIRPRPRLSLHSKFVLTTTAALLVIGTVSYYALERWGAFREMTTADALLNSWFCSVTARSGGFNTIDYTSLGGPALLCTMVLMFIGGSPGSVTGGVKTSTFGLLLVYALYRWRGHDTPHAFKRSIPRETVDRASAVVIVSVGVIIIGGSLLMATEARSADPFESQAKFLPVMFESFSAFGTVGLSMNVTPGLSAAGKFVLTILMFVGRLGPITLALAIGSGRRGSTFTYAEENVMVG
jgi:trk system potassium uptake protein